MIEELLRAVPERRPVRRGNDFGRGVHVCGPAEEAQEGIRANLGQMRLVRKETPNSTRKIDSVVGDALALEARADALAAGWTDEPAETYFRLPR